MNAAKKAIYREECRKRWDGPALRNALSNWSDFQEIEEQLIAALRDYHRDPQLEDAFGKCHNPDGTLTAFLWSLQTALNPDRSSLYPLLDFEEHYQKVFLRRGLIVYCSFLLRSFEAAGAPTVEPASLVLSS